VRRLVLTNCIFLVVAALASAACGSSSTYRVDSKFTPEPSPWRSQCDGATKAIEVPQLPAADRVLGDLIVRCKNDCPREYAVSALLREAQKLAAPHVSSLVCVRAEKDWECVGRLSAPEHCNEAGE
jgi:hypothetical protein